MSRNQIPQHSRLTWLRGCLPFQQSPQHPFWYILFHQILYSSIFMSLLPCLCSLSSLFLAPSFLDTSVCTGLFWQLWLKCSCLQEFFLLSLPKLFVLLWPDQYLLWVMLPVYPILLDYKCFESRVRVMFEVFWTPLACNSEVHVPQVVLIKHIPAKCILSVWMWHGALMVICGVFM